MPERNSPSPPLSLYGVSTRTFIVLSFLSFGLYERYWCYKNWKCLRVASGEDLSPFWRAFFAQFWGFSLFRRIKVAAVAAGVPVAWDSNLIATIYLLCNLSLGLPLPWGLIGLFGFAAIIPVQRTAQRLNLPPAGPGLRQIQTARKAPRSATDWLQALLTASLRATTMLKPAVAGGIAAFLSLLIFHAWLGLGLAYLLTPTAQAALWIAVVGTLVGLFAGLGGQPRTALACFAVPVIALAALQIIWNQHLEQQRLEDAQSIRFEKQQHLTQELTRAQCDNDDLLRSFDIA